MLQNRPNARKALFNLSKRKQEHLNTPPNPAIQPWDLEYYCPSEPPAPPIPLPPLTLGTVFMGLSRLFKHLYGLTLRPSSVSLGQVWHPDVRKLHVVGEDNEILGFIYLDLFEREGKRRGAAHYTVSSSRRTDDDDEPGDYPSAEAWNDPQLASSREFGSVHRMRRRGRDGMYQLPVVVLLCNHAPPSTTTGPSILEWVQVQCLAHEMGHAMHCESSGRQCLPSYTHGQYVSDVRANRVSQCLGDSMRQRFRGTAIHPHGNIPDLTKGPLLV